MVGCLHPRTQILLGTMLVCLSLAASSFLKPHPSHFLLFSIIYGAGFGFVNGITYMVSVKNSWAAFPQKPALASGIVISGFGLGSLIFTKFSQTIMNPDGLSITEENQAFMHERAVEVLPSML